MLLKGIEKYSTGVISKRLFVKLLLRPIMFLVTFGKTFNVYFLYNYLKLEKTSGLSVLCFEYNGKKKSLSPNTMCN